MTREERNQITCRIFIVLDGLMRILAILQAKSVGILLVSDGVLAIIISVLSMFSFKKLELRHSVISFIQAEILSIRVDQAYRYRFGCHKCRNDS